MRILRRFAFPVLCVFYLVACNTAQTIPVEALGDTPTGVTTLAVSLPGYGGTEVPPGLDPEITLNVVLDAVSLVKKLPWIDSKRFYLYGFSRGAFFVSLLANRIEGIKGVVLQSGAYDLNRFYQDTLWFRSMLNPNGEQTRSSSASCPRSPRGTRRPYSCTVERICWFPSNKRIS